MECPYCLHPESKVTDKRKSPEGIRRRRECLSCKKRFTTYERLYRDEFFVVKKDGTKEKFDKAKLEKGVKKAFEKRPVDESKINKMLHNIEEILRKKGKKEINSTIIGELVMRRIKKLDNVAYIRFASVYRNFQDLTDFQSAIKEA